MNQINSKRIVSSLSEKFGISLTINTASALLEVRPIDIEYGEGFKICLKSEWRTLSVEFIPDNFSANLLRTMGTSKPTKKEIFKELAEQYTQKYTEITMKINSKDFSLIEPENWDNNWGQFYLRIGKFPFILDELTNIEIENAIIEILGDMLSLIISLLPLEETIIDESISGLPEGALTRVEVNRYERSQYNRQACLSIHGYICKACKFNFEEKYGDIGKGFIHVHHIVPVSKLDSNYEVNPKTDLIPLCPNCHAMIHKRNPPYSIEELKDIIYQNSGITTSGE
ncbi:HNH endonuclease [Cytobacillus oceanisediminis]|uniref:HNH domain-containing protein n=1 Tax=Cytobacillus oceanisediminis TaxID=665099 RepID=A0ABX3CZC2_9BACI|nr:HNH endonuclease [Cytobacillus oceanisediminis]OHX50689.1 hypothetical protein BBV17_06615 [Cytobacillus oceanisediminis]